MRRKEFEVSDLEQCELFLKELHDGVLTFTGVDGWPKAVPLNFARPQLPNTCRRIKHQGFKIQAESVVRKSMHLSRSFGLAILYSAITFHSVCQNVILPIHTFCILNPSTAIR